MQFGLYIVSFGARSRDRVFIIITYRVTLDVLNVGGNALLVLSNYYQLANLNKLITLKLV